MTGHMILALTAAALVIGAGIGRQWCRYRCAEKRDQAKLAARLRR